MLDTGAAEPRKLKVHPRGCCCCCCCCVSVDDGELEVGAAGDCAEGDACVEGSVLVADVDGKGLAVTAGASSS